MYILRTLVHVNRRDSNSASIVPKMERAYRSASKSFCDWTFVEPFYTGDVLMPSIGTPTAAP